MAQVHINGQKELLSVPTTIQTLLQQAGLEGRRLAVELNGQIIPKNRHEHYYLKDHDMIEIITAVGGG